MLIKKSRCNGRSDVIDRRVVDQTMILKQLYQSIKARVPTLSTEECAFLIYSLLIYRWDKFNDYDFSDLNGILVWSDEYIKNDCEIFSQLKLINDLYK